MFLTYQTTENYVDCERNGGCAPKVRIFAHMYKNYTYQIRQDARTHTLPHTQLTGQSRTQLVKYSILYDKKRWIWSY